MTITGGSSLAKEDIIIVTNIFGNCVDIDKYTSWVKDDKKNTSRFLIFDNAATSYTFYKSKNCLNYGNGSIVSFHHTKPFGFGEGGAIIVDKKYERTIRCLNNFGIGLFPDSYWSKYGNNNKMSDVSASFILQYLYQNFDHITESHQRLYRYFVFQMTERKIQCFRLFPSFHDSIITVSCFSLLFLTHPSDDLMKDLTRQGIICRQYYHPLRPTAIASKFYSHILCLPCNMDMEENHIDKMLDIILYHCSYKCIL
jgi:dTDP-4-amino-4,6-dideoxygalactose transaminase